MATGSLKLNMCCLFILLSGANMEILAAGPTNVSQSLSSKDEMLLKETISEALRIGYLGQNTARFFADAAARSLGLWKRASEKGNADAQLLLAIYYSDTDSTKALDLSRKSAEGGNSWAMMNVGASYAFGEGTRQDYATALRWYLKAAEAG